MEHEIVRRFVYQDNKTGLQTAIEEGELTTLPSPFVILGDPGSGKSVVTQKLGQLKGYRYLPAGKFVRSKQPQTFLEDVTCLVIDGLDEITSTAIGGGVVAVLEQLSAIGNPDFILSCREVDWRGAADKVQISEDYDLDPILLHLQLFSRDDAHAFLSDEFPAVDAGDLLQHLSKRGLEEIYENPLTLRMIGEVASHTGTLPNSRAELFAEACRLMIQEENPHHAGAAHTTIPEEALLVSAGAHFATHLLCDMVGTYTGPVTKTPEGYVPVADIAALRLATAASEVLKTRLFRAEAEATFTSVHRVISEYLGAKWIAKCFEGGVSESRIWGLFQQGDGVPTSLRGLHAWIAHFNHVLAVRCIRSDPYGVLRYGEIDMLPLSQADLLLRELAELSKADPYFLARESRRYPASGLMRRELKQQVRDHLTAQGKSSHLKMMLLEALEESPLADELTSELEAVALDLTRYSGERTSAGEILAKTLDTSNFEILLRELLNRGDRGSHGVAFNILRDGALQPINNSLIIEIILAHFGLTVSHGLSADEDRFSFGYVSNRLFNGVKVPKLVTFLDELASYSFLLKGAQSTAKFAVTDLALLGTSIVLESSFPVSPEQLWRWIGWTRATDGIDRGKREKIAGLLETKNVKLDIYRHVLIDPFGDDIIKQAWKLSDAGFGLGISNDDLAVLIGDFAKKHSTKRGYGKKLAILVSLGHHLTGLEPSVQSAAIKAANGMKSVLRRIEVLSRSRAKELADREAKRLAARRKERDEEFLELQTRHSMEKAKITAGDIGQLYYASEIYLGHTGDLSEPIPEERVWAALGKPLGDQALDGFIAALKRKGLPSVSKIVASHMKGKFYYAEHVLICGIGEMLRRNISPATLPKRILEICLISSRRGPELKIEGRGEVSEILESIVLTSDQEAERYFRSSIEPQLVKRLVNVEDYYFLSHNDQWSRLAGRLTIEWLSNFQFSDVVLVEMIDTALTKGKRADLLVLSTGKRSNTFPSENQRTVWLAVDFLLDLGGTISSQTAAASSNRDYIWYLRNRVHSRRHGPSEQLSVGQRQFIIEKFWTTWPYVPRPSSSSGDQNPWDATQFIEEQIYGIANNPNSDATLALQHLATILTGTYQTVSLHALALQRKLRRDSEYKARTPAQLKAVIDDLLPESIDDMRAYLQDRLITLQKRLKGSDTSRNIVYWNNGIPQGENYCRDRMIDDISGQLPPSIRFVPEMHMQDQKRSDIAAIRNLIGLPVEIKGQWHTEVWDAPVNQLAALYAHDWRAEGRGAYIVLWFGSASGKNLTAHPNGLPPPQSPEELQSMLRKRVPDEHKALFDIYVIEIPTPKPKPATTIPKPPKNATRQKAAGGSPKRAAP